ncbi:MAG: hypothetical protein HYR56_11735 [Acidobacteria bacterium]|nr:hypothetical protein [Acidobacteriota bacterium]MBI3423508.1 hypothetical protein [Acidobacteriota bacterium]
MMQVKRTALMLVVLLGGWVTCVAHAQATNRRCAPPVPVAQDRWRGEYFANRNLSGAPVLVRDEGVGDLFFDWGLNAPDSECSLPVDDFSARWARTLTFSPGTYRFTVTADDGVRVLIDDRVVIDEWHEQAMLTRVADVDLTGGAHRLVVEYFEHLGSAAIKFNWSRTPCLAKVAIDHWRGEYFANRELNGQPLMVSDDGMGFLDFPWGLAGPSASCLRLTDNFSARWTRTFAFAPGYYRFKVNADDGVRLFIDKQLKLDQWMPQRGEHVVDVELGGGNHQLVLEYFEQYGSAEVGLRWERHPCLATVAADHWKGEYFAASDLTGPPLQIRDEGDGPLELAFDKAGDKQGCLKREEFSARWTRKATFANGTYRFTVESRERVRFLLDGETLVHQWQEPKASPTTMEVVVPAGNHRLTLEYAKVPGAGAVRLRWEAVARSASVKR